jgi:hypothetical protein
MATTSTNKQPLLVDRVFHNVVKTTTLASGSATSIDIEGTNEATVLVDCTRNDGGVIEDLYVISRAAQAANEYTTLLYLSSSVDYLRPNEAVYVGKVVSTDSYGAISRSSEMPFVLAPLPQAGDHAQVTSFYVPKGRALWCTIQVAGPVTAGDTPIVGAQGGFY